MRSYEHFTISERESLVEMRKEGISIRKMAARLGKNPSSVSRELRRNANKRTGYNAWHATSQYIHRRKACRRSSRILKDPLLEAFIREKLGQYWPPETIVAIWKRENPQARLSHTTLYRALHHGWITGRTPKDHLRRRGTHRYRNRSKFNTIIPEHNISERPACVAERSRIGDWEGDCIVSGKHGKAKLFTCIDRTSRFVVATRSSGSDAASLYEAMLRVLEGQPMHTLTLDNGSEFAKHAELAQALGITIYFADPHAPWQRGANEQVNGMLRFFFPKSTDFSLVDDASIQFALDSLNDRPRKCLHWLSPRQVFLNKCCT